MTKSVTIDMAFDAAGQVTGHADLLESLERLIRQLKKSRNTGRNMSFLLERQHAKERALLLSWTGPVSFDASVGGWPLLLLAAPFLGAVTKYLHTQSTMAEWSTGFCIGSVKCHVCFSRGVVAAFLHNQMHCMRSLSLQIRQEQYAASFVLLIY